jgi:hypothetical protein
MVISLRPLRFDLDVDRDRLADAGHCFGCGSKHQIEVAPRDWVGRHRPTRPPRFIDRREQFHVKRDRLGHAMHGEIAEDVAGLRPSPLHVSTFESDLRKFFHIEEFRATQMIVSFLNARVDAAYLDLGDDRGILRMLAVDFDLAAESCKFAMGGTEKLMHGETNHRAGRIELVGLASRYDRT